RTPCPRRGDPGRPSPDPPVFDGAMRGSTRLSRTGAAANPEERRGGERGITIGAGVMASSQQTYTARWIFPVAAPPLAGGTITIKGSEITAVEPHGTCRADVDFGN